MKRLRWIDYTYLKEARGELFRYEWDKQDGTLRIKNDYYLVEIKGIRDFEQVRSWCREHNASCHPLRSALPLTLSLTDRMELLIPELQKQRVANQQLKAQVEEAAAYVDNLRKFE